MTNAKKWAGLTDDERGLISEIGRTGHMKHDVFLRAYGLPLIHQGLAVNNTVDGRYATRLTAEGMKVFQSATDAQGDK